MQGSTLGHVYRKLLAVSLQNEADVFKWVIRKEFEELHRYIDEEKATFLESVEGKAAQLITSIESQVKQISDTLQRLKEMQSILETLGNENQLDFIRVSVPTSDCLRKMVRVSQALPPSAPCS